MTIHAYILLIAFIMSMPFMQDTDFGDQYEPGLVMATAALDFLVIFCMCLVMWAVAGGEGQSFGRIKEKTKSKFIHPEVNPNDFYAERTELLKKNMDQLKVDNGSSVFNQAEEEENTTAGPGGVPASPNAGFNSGALDLENREDDGIDREGLSDFY